MTLHVEPTDDVWRGATVGSRWRGASPPATYIVTGGHWNPLYGTSVWMIRADVHYDHTDQIGFEQCDVDWFVDPRWRVREVEGR